jgi:anti-sigma factor RsiW
LDGELDPEARRAVDEALASDSELHMRLEALAITMPAIKAAFDNTLSEAPKYEAPPVTKPARRSFGIAAALAIGIGLGSLLPMLGQRDALDWRQAIANYQVLYVTDTLVGADIGQDAALRRLEMMSEVLGRDITAAYVADGLKFRRAQVLGIEGRPLIQMAYLSGTSEPFAICVTRVDESDYAPQSEYLAGLAATHWVNDGFGFLVIGGQDLSHVARVANGLSGAI